MRFFVLTATYELRVSRKSHLRDHPTMDPYLFRLLAGSGSLSVFRIRTQERQYGKKKMSKVRFLKSLMFCQEGGRRLLLYVV
jgi:hypothetical protein